MRESYARHDEERHGPHSEASSMVLPISMNDFSTFSPVFALVSNTEHLTEDPNDSRSDKEKDFSRSALLPRIITGMSPTTALKLPSQSFRLFIVSGRVKSQTARAPVAPL